MKKTVKISKGQIIGGKLAGSISVVMVSFMTGPSLIEAVESVLADPDIFELILVDNGNSQAARRQIAQRFSAYDKVRVLQGHGNVGFGRACNYGARLALGHYVLFLNPDAIIKKGSARALATTGEGLLRPWLVGGMLLDAEGHEQRGSRRAALTPISAIAGFVPILGKLFGWRSIYRETDPLPKGPALIETISGACMMTDRPSFEQMGGFDERYFLHVEDIEICRRTYRMGGQVGFVPQASVMHYGSTSKQSHWRIEVEKFKGFIRYFWNYKAGILPKVLTLMAMPFIAMAMIGRAVISSLRGSLTRR